MRDLVARIFGQLAGELQYFVTEMNDYKKVFTKKFVARREFRFHYGGLITALLVVLICTYVLQNATLHDI